MERVTEKKILFAAEEEFMTKGFAGARTISIAEKAGVTHAMLHYYFRTKEKLFERIIIEKIEMISQILSQSISKENGSIFERVKNIIDKHLDFLSLNPNIPRFIIGELYSNPTGSKILQEKLKKFVPIALERFQCLINEEAEKGKCRKIDARTLLIEIMSLNVFPYMAAPLLNIILGKNGVESEEFLEEKKKTNFEIIMKKLKP